MTTGFFGDIKKVKYEGPDSTNPLAYRFYNPDEVVAGKRLEDHLRFAVAYWHSFAWPGGDPFGGQTFDRPWFPKGGQIDTMELAKLKADVAFEMFSLLGVPYYCFHDADVRPGGQDFRRKRGASRRDRRLFRRQDEEDAASSCSGAPPICSRIAASCRARRPIPIRTCLPMRRRR